MTAMQLYEIRDLKRRLDEKILHMVEEFEHKTCLEVVGIYIERMDTTEMGDSGRKSIVAGVEVQAMLEPVIAAKGGGEE